MSDEERETKPFKFVTGMTPPSVAIELERKLTLVDPNSRYAQPLHFHVAACHSLRATFQPYVELIATTTNDAMRL